MKYLKFLFPVLLCTLLLGFSSCKETNADRLRAMCGDWKSVKIVRHLPFLKKTGITG